MILVSKSNDKPCLTWILILTSLSGSMWSIGSRNISTFLDKQTKPNDYTMRSTIKLRGLCEFIVDDLPYHHLSMVNVARIEAETISQMQRNPLPLCGKIRWWRSWGTRQRAIAVINNEGKLKEENLVSRILQPPSHHPRFVAPQSLCYSPSISAGMRRKPSLAEYNMKTNISFLEQFINQNNWN